MQLGSSATVLAEMLSGDAESVQLVPIGQFLVGGLEEIVDGFQQLACSRVGLIASQAFGEDIVVAGATKGDTQLLRGIPSWW